MISISKTWVQVGYCISFPCPDWLHGHTGYWDLGPFSIKILFCMSNSKRCFLFCTLCNHWTFIILNCHKHKKVSLVKHTIDVIHLLEKKWNNKPVLPKKKENHANVDVNVILPILKQMGLALQYETNICKLRRSWNKWPSSQSSLVVLLIFRQIAKNQRKIS